MKFGVPLPMMTRSAPAARILSIVAVQLHHVLAAVNSTEVANEHEHRGAVAPERAELDRSACSSSTVIFARSSARLSMAPIVTYEPWRAMHVRAVPATRWRDAAACYLDGLPAPTALALMRSRYTAFVRGAIDYLLDTHDASTRGSVDRAGDRRVVA